MNLGQNSNRIPKHPAEPPFALRTYVIRGGGVALLATFMLVAGAAQTGQQSPPANPTKTNLAPAPNQSSDAKIQSASQNPKTKPQAAAVDPRRKQLSDESAQLLALALALKVEVDKTDKDTLSLAVIRKADEIEKLARDVKEKMKVTAGGN